MITENRLSELRWYLIQAHTKQEDRVDKNLRLLGSPTLSPKIRKARYNAFTGRPTYVTAPLFPNYIFARFRLNDLYHKVRYVRGVLCLVSFENQPAAVEDSVIELIQSRIGNDGYVEVGRVSATREKLNPGDEVVIKEGALRGLTGIFEREMPGADRVRILLNTISYQANVEVESSAVEERHAHASAAALAAFG